MQIADFLSFFAFAASKTYRAKWQIMFQNLWCSVCRVLVVPASKLSKNAISFVWNLANSCWKRDGSSVPKFSAELVFLDLLVTCLNYGWISFVFIYWEQLLHESWMGNCLPLSLIFKYFLVTGTSKLSSSSRETSLTVYFKHLIDWLCGERD